MSEKWGIVRIYYSPPYPIPRLKAPACIHGDERRVSCLEQGRERTTQDASPLTDPTLVGKLVLEAAREQQRSHGKENLPLPDLSD
jgi:hypothetical protein